MPLMTGLFSKKNRNIQFILHYLNPLDRLGYRSYSFLFPLFTTVFCFSFVEIVNKTILRDPNAYSIIVIITSIALIVYFAFRDSLKGGFAAVVITIIYYFYIIFAHHYSPSQRNSGIQTTFFLSILYLLIAGIIGFLKSTIDTLIQRETEARTFAENGQRRLTTIMQQLPVGVIIVDKKDKIVEGNRQIKEILGKKPETFLQDAQKTSPYIWHKGRQLPLKKWPIMRALTKGETVKVEEMEYIRLDKKHIFLRVNAAPVKNKNNKVIAAVSTFYDITRERQAEEAHYKFMAMVESSGDAIISKTLDGILTSWNKSAERLLGHSAKEAIGKHINLIVPTDLRLQEEEIMQKLKRGIKLEHFETFRLTKNRKKIPVSMSMSPIKNSAGKIIGIANITRDITKQKEQERQKDNFIAIATHELKTPITSLKGFTQVLQLLSERKQDEKSTYLLKKMDAQLNKLTNLIGDLFDSTKIQTGHLALSKRFFDFNSMARGVIESMQLTTEQHVLTLVGRASKEVYGDKDKTEQVLVNLISNAIKYSPEGKHITIGVSDKKSFIQVFVKDAGIGIPKEKQEKVFQQFFRVSGPYTQTFPGLGLGLYISSAIIKHLGGKIWVESVEGKGSTFYFRIPVNKRKII